MEFSINRLQVGVALSAAFLVMFLSSLGWANSSQDALKITRTGIADVLEMGMTLAQIDGKGIKYIERQSPYSRPGHHIYAVPRLGVDFETEKGMVIRIWCFAEMNRDLVIVLPKIKKETRLDQVNVFDILENFGPVKKYFNQNAPKGREEATWIKYRPFGIECNTISYPDGPFLFGLNWDDTLSYITVSKAD